MKFSFYRRSCLMVVRTTLTLILVGGLFSVQSCKWLSRKTARIDKPSPTGAYRVMFESTIEDEDAWGRFHEWGNIQYLKGSEIINSRKWDYIDSWEDSVMGTHENIAWLGDNILYMGGDEILADKPMDEITISNTTPEILNYLSISFSKYSNITVFDFPAAAQVKVRVPIIKSWRNREGEIHWSLFYSGEARSKRGVTGNREAVQKTTSPNEGASLSLEIR